MKQIKIISNPYEKYTKFQLNSDSQEDEVWVDIDSSLNPKCQLLSKEFTTKFFPFKIDEIVDAIVQEYGIGEPEIQIVFKGTLDHYNDLKEVIEMNNYKVNIHLIRDDDYLLNAQDVLPKVIKIFNKLMPIVELCDKNKKDIEFYLKKFAESSADVIPLCVIGNVSAGKSTFINSLIGKEILPSGDDPVTARIFKIIQLDNDENMYSKFYYDGIEVILQFDNQLKISENCPQEIKSVFEQIIQDNEDSLMIKIMNECFSFLNSTKDNKLNPLIEIGTPFVKGIWNECNNKFIIIDTPGSNSASNEDHSSILDEALKDLTNGLPLYVSKPSDLDTTDNLNLFNKIKSMPEIDSRFTMIIANQADNAKLPDEGYFKKSKEKQILGLSTPRNMYSIGIYYVSSIMGLGSKTGEEFSSISFKRTYMKNKDFFEIDSDYALKLYNYNIMPDQIKKHNIESCLSKLDDPIYVNSGLYSVETGIQNYANKYSAYNKCQQSVLYLSKVTKLVDKELNDIKQRCETHKAELSSKLEEEKKELMDALEHTAEDKKRNFVIFGKNQLKEYTDSNIPKITQKTLYDYEDNFTTKQRNNVGYDKYTKMHQDSINDFKNDLNNLGKNLFNSSLEKTGQNLMRAGEGIAKIVSTSIEQRNKRKEANEKAANDIFYQISEDYKQITELFFSNLNLLSQHTWDEKSEAIRQILIKIVSESEILDTDKKNELEDIIINYENINYDIPDKPNIKLKEYKLFFSEGKLNLPKLQKKINDECKNYALSALVNIEENHIRCLDIWLTKLLQQIRLNIVSYNPTLSKLQTQINIENSNIEELTYKQEMIKKYIEHINDLMTWQVV